MRDESGPRCNTKRKPSGHCASAPAEYDEVVERFATDRSDEPLDMAVLPRRAWCDRVISNPYCTNAADVSWTECAVAVANQVTRCFDPRKGIRHLSRDPLGGRTARYADAHQSPAGVTKNDQAIEQFEGDGVNHEQIDGRDPSGVIAQEGSNPGRAVRAAWSCSWPRLIGPLRSRASAIRRGSAALPTRGSRGSSVV